MRVQNPVITMVVVETCAAERSLSGMKRLKTPLQSTMSEERLNSLATLHIHKYKNVDIDNIVSEFARRKGRRLAQFIIHQSNNIHLHQ